MGWKKLGLIYTPNSRLYWQYSHAALPTALHLYNDYFRIYYTSRDKYNRSFIGYFEINIKEPKEVIFQTDSPVLTPGELGCFDDHGVQATSIVKSGDKYYLYYLGWNPSLTKPLFYASIGLAISDDEGKTFKKYSNAPILSRSDYDPWMVSGGTVRKENNIWRMWYLSGFKFEIVEKRANSFYDIKYAESNDGINWIREGKVCIGLQHEETNISRLTIIEEDNIYKAWFPVKGKDKLYRIGYAESKDGIDWTRKKEKGNIDVSETGWDSEAIDKIEVIKHNNTKYMLYNGNNFGYDGIGLAVYED